jgi:hypothetical protein
MEFGLLVDALDAGQALLAARIASSAGLDCLWLPDAAPRGPCSPELAAAISELTTVPVRVVSDHPVIRSAPDRDLSAAVAAACGGVLEVPVSIGRTRQEAFARVVATPAFLHTGTPADQGLFGTLEDCQQQVQLWARAGVRGLCMVVPDPDLPDVLAQLRAVAIGNRAAPFSAERSPDPLPPAGWGGRAARRAVPGSG